MRSNRKHPGYKEIRFWADPDLLRRLEDVCHVLPMNMPDLVEDLVRNQLPTVEKNVWGRYQRPVRWVKSKRPVVNIEDVVLE